MQQIPVFETIMLTCGFLFLAYAGWVTWHSRPYPDETQKNVSAKKQAAFAAAVSLLNPHAILDTAGVIGTQSLQYTGLDKWLYTLSCIAVSWVWFIVWFWPGECLKHWIRRRTDDRIKSMFSFGDVGGCNLFRGRTAVLKKGNAE
ncbi:hypothetical protein C6W24_11930 [Bacillus atrophaeus]|uniref:LysE/ArgO family amino acid transporter n=1 Tax=Bacillus atrophaeus TaxID=1452 RepID=UPI000D045467|nr:LysE family transporter [Bacillus atrophaeus]PRR97504.1 hypothetical protein C6W24_11930 [Bacillus atrophaeus]